jgi:N-acetylglucosamine transport system permease protein
MATDTISTPTRQPLARRASTNVGERISQWLLSGVLILWSIIVIFPMWWLLYTSFKTDREIFFSPWALPGALHLLQPVGLAWGSAMEQL